MGDEDAVGIRIRDARLVRQRRRLGDHRRRTRRDVPEQPHDRRHHRGPALALLHAFGRAQRRERDRALRPRHQMAALEERLERAGERARRERQLLGRGTREDRRRPAGAGAQRVEEIEAEERGRETGRGGTEHACLRGNG